MIYAHGPLFIGFYARWYGVLHLLSKNKKVLWLLSRSHFAPQQRAFQSIEPSSWETEKTKPEIWPLLRLDNVLWESFANNSKTSCNCCYKMYLFKHNNKRNNFYIGPSDWKCYFSFSLVAALLRKCLTGLDNLLHPSWTFSVRVAWSIWLKLRLWECNCHFEYNYAFMKFMHFYVLQARVVNGELKVQAFHNDAHHTHIAQVARRFR